MAAGRCTGAISGNSSIGAGKADSSTEVEDNTRRMEQFQHMMAQIVKARLPKTIMHWEKKSANWCGIMY